MIFGVSRGFASAIVVNYIKQLTVILNQDFSIATVHVLFKLIIIIHVIGKYNIYISCESKSARLFG